MQGKKLYLRLPLPNIPAGIHHQSHLGAQRHHIPLLIQNYHVQIGSAVPHRLGLHAAIQPLHPARR